MPQRRVPPPKGYMTASRAKQLLGNISDGMLRTYITKGMIERLVPDTRSQGFYKIEDVRSLAARLNIDRSIQFSRGTVDDLAECSILLDNVFWAGPWSNPIERRATWITKNPDSLFILRAGRSLVGAIFMLPLTQGKIQQILENETTIGIYAEDIQPFTLGTPVHLYAMSACVYARDKNIVTKRFYGSRLLSGILKWVVQLGHEGIPITAIWSRSETPDGIGLLRHVGFTEIETITNYRNYLIDVKLSGIPDVVKYKRAYAEYRQSHQEAPQTLYRYKTDREEALSVEATPAQREEPDA
jgi:hypothetical protein